MTDVMLTLGDVAKALGASLPASLNGVGFERVESDTRKLAPGCLFVALKGPNFDGHDFLAQAEAQGAVAAVVERYVEASNLAQIVCADTRLGFGLIARAQRERWQGPLVAITGNSGKTTVKEMTAALLGALGDTLATTANLNNDFGVPQTLLRLRENHRAAVVELGANHLGEIAWTTQLVRPDVAIITNVTGAHVGEFGGMGHIAQAKGEILLGLSAQGTAILNRDDHYYPLWARMAQPRSVMTFGLGERTPTQHAGAGQTHPKQKDPDVTASALSCDSQGRYAFTLVFKGQALGDVQLPLLGRHNVSNALAAAAAALALGVSPAEVVRRLSTLASLPGRLSVEAGLNDWRLLDDSYNANPGAVKAALDALVALPGPHWCALGAMGEMGADSDALHAEIGAYAANIGITSLLTLGDAARPASEAFGRGLHFNDHATLVRHLIHSMPPGASLLVKGSRSARMEHVVNALRLKK